MVFFFFTEMKFMKRFATQDMKLRKEAAPLLVNGQAAEREQEQPISGYQCISIKTTDEHRLKNMIA